MNGIGSMDEGILMELVGSSRMGVLLEDSYVHSTWAGIINRVMRVRKLAATWFRQVVLGDVWKIHGMKSLGDKVSRSCFSTCHRCRLDVADSRLTLIAPVDSEPFLPKSQLYTKAISVWPLQIKSLTACLHIHSEVCYVYCTSDQKSNDVCMGFRLCSIQVRITHFCISVIVNLTFFIQGYMKCQTSINEYCLCGLTVSAILPLSSGLGIMVDGGFGSDKWRGSPALLRGCGSLTDYNRLLIMASC